MAKYDWTGHVPLPGAVDEETVNGLHAAPPFVERYMMLVRAANPPPPSFMPAMKTVPSLPGLPVICTFLIKPPVCTWTGALHVVPLSE
jgi:hypothetical protein